MGTEWAPRSGFLLPRAQGPSSHPAPSPPSPHPRPPQHIAAIARAELYFADFEDSDRETTIRLEFFTSFVPFVYVVILNHKLL